MMNPYTTCAHVLDTLRMSGLAYTLNETPYSVYLTLRKKFTKECASRRPQQVSQVSRECQESSESQAKIFQLQEALKLEISRHEQTKHQLYLKDKELEKSCDINNMNIEESRKTHHNQITIMAKLTDDLAREVDEHAESENELRKMEEKVENLHTKLKEEVKQREDITERNEQLKEKLEDAEQATDNYSTMLSDLNKKLLHYEFKLADLASLDTAVLKARVKELEGIVEGKTRIISLLKHQAELSLKEISHLRQNRTSSPPSEEPAHLHSSQSCSTFDTSGLMTACSSSSSQIFTPPAGISQLVTHCSTRSHQRKLHKTVHQILKNIVRIVKMNSQMVLMSYFPPLYISTLFLTSAPPHGCIMVTACPAWR